MFCPLICSWQHYDIVLLAAFYKWGKSSSERWSDSLKVTQQSRTESGEETWSSGFKSTFLPIIPPLISMHRAAGDAETFSQLIRKKEREGKGRGRGGERERENFCSEILTTKYFCKCCLQPSLSRRPKLWPAQILFLYSKCFLDQPGKKRWRSRPKK